MRALSFLLSKQLESHTLRRAQKSRAHLEARPVSDPQSLTGMPD